MTNRSSDETPADARYREHLEQQGVTGDEFDAAMEAWRASFQAGDETPADARYRKHLEQQGITGDEFDAAMEAWRASFQAGDETPADARYREHLEQQGVTGDEFDAAMEAWRASFQAGDETPADARYREHLEQQGITGDEFDTAMEAWRASLETDEVAARGTDAGDASVDTELAAVRRALDQPGRERLERLLGRIGEVGASEEEQLRAALAETVVPPTEVNPFRAQSPSLQEAIVSHLFLTIQRQEAEIRSQIEATREQADDTASSLDHRAPGGDTAALREAVGRRAQLFEMVSSTLRRHDEAVTRVLTGISGGGAPGGNALETFAGRPSSDLPTPAFTISEPDRDELSITTTGVHFTSANQGEPAATSTRPRSRRSSADGLDAGPYAPSSTPGSRGRPIIPAAIAAIVVVLVLAGAFVLFRPGGDEPVPASDGSTNAASGVGATTSEPTSVATEGGAGTAGQDLPQGTPNATIDLNALAAEFFTANGTPAQRATALTYVDRRPDSTAVPPEWVDGVSAFFFIDAGGEAWVQIDAPQELASNLCGEVDIITGRNQHAGDGIDFCSEGAQAPYYFTDIAALAVPAGAARVTIIVRSGQVLVEDNDRVSVWVFDAVDPDNFEAAEYVGQAAFAEPIDASTLEGIEVGLGFEAVGASVTE